MLTRIKIIITRVTERALKPPSVTSNQPLNFEFYYGDRAASAEMNTVYLDDGNAKVDLNLEVFNESSKTITFVPASSGNSSQGRFPQVGSSNSANEANEARCHFSLVFAKDLNINPEEIELQDAQKNDWQVNYDENSQFTTLYFLRKQRLVLQAKNPENTSDSILLTFQNFAARNGLVKTSNVKLTYGSALLLDGQNTPFTSSITVNNAISVTNHPENKNIPLQVRCIGSNTILNDGTSPNTLTWQIVNRSLSANRPNLLLDQANSKFIVRFETDDGAEALTTPDKATNVTVTPTDSTNWMVDKTTNQAEWTVKLKSSSTKTKLVDKETIELNISNLVTSNPSGVAYLYITYQNIGTYPDGQLVVPIEKTPLLFRTERDRSPLEFVSWSNGWNIQTGTQNKHLYLNRDATETSSVYIGQNGKELCVESTGKVGIGTSSPSEKLHVSGKAIISEKLAIRTTTPTTVDLAIGDNETGLKQEGENKLAIYTNNTERVRIDDSGNVGIGTTSPSAKLHVDGNIRLSGNIENGADGKVSLYTNTSALNSYAWIEMRGWPSDDLTQTGKMTLAGDNIDFRCGSSPSKYGKVGIKLDSSGNVGIGTGTNFVLDKLHVIGNTRVVGNLNVYGDFYIDGDKPMQFKTYTSNNDNPTIPTDYPSADWFAIVAGFSGFSQNSQSITGMKVLPKIENGKWVIKCDAGYTQLESWEIKVLFIRTELIREMT